MPYPLDVVSLMSIVLESSCPRVAAWVIINVRTGVHSRSGLGVQLETRIPAQIPLREPMAVRLVITGRRGIHIQSPVRHWVGPWPDWIFEGAGVGKRPPSILTPHS